MSETTKKGEMALRDKAVLHQQRRLKQATLFTHKDSADLLPLDGLNRLGTSKDLQPHSIVQRRLMEGSGPRMRAEARGDGGGGGLGLGGLGGGTVRSPLADHKDGGSGEGAEERRSESTAGDSAGEERESPEESERSLRSEEAEEEEEEEEGEDISGGEAAAKPLTPTATPGVKEEEEEEDEEEEGGTASPTTPLVALVVQCKCGEADVQASIDTGCQHNHISSVCCRRLGLVAEQDSAGAPRTVRALHLQLGTQRLLCSAHVKDDKVSELCLGLQTLLELKCCVDLSGRVLRLQGSGEELPFLAPGAGGGGSSLPRRHDTDENL